MAAISVIIPVYNTLIPYFHECIASVLAQSFTDYEVWLIDDGSNNGVEKVCDDYAQKDERFKVIHQKNQGVSVARNEGIRQAIRSNEEGYIIFLDADDWWNRETLELIYERSKNENLDIIIFGIYEDKTDSRNESNCFANEEKDYFIIADSELKREMQIGLFRGNLRKIPACMGVVTNQLIKVSLIKNDSLHFDESVELSEDTLFDLELWERARRIGLINCSLYHYRYYGSSSSFKYRPDAGRTLDCVNNKLKEFILKYDKGEDFFVAYDEWLEKRYNKVWEIDFNHKDNPKTLKEQQKEWATFPERYASFQRLRTFWNVCSVRKKAMYLAVFKFRSIELTHIVIHLSWKVWHIRQSLKKQCDKIIGAVKWKQMQ